MGNNDTDLLHVIRRCRKFGPDIAARFGGDVLQPPTTDAVVFRVTHYKIFLLVDTIDERHAADAVEVFDAVVRIAIVITERDRLRAIVDHGKLQGQGIIARPF